jgi:hypothetical protein
MYFTVLVEIHLNLFIEGIAALVGSKLGLLADVDP